MSNNKSKSCNTQAQSTYSRWNSNQPRRMVNNVQSTVASSDTSGILFSQQQLDQLAKLMQKTHQKGSETDEEIDYHFSGMLTCNAATKKTSQWIIDSGAIDHMTWSMSCLQNPVKFLQPCKIKLPTGANTEITHQGTICLNGGLVLESVLCVPQFHHNLLSVQKLLKDNKFEIKFHSTHCVLYHAASNVIVAVGQVRDGLYYLIDTDKPADYLVSIQAHNAPGSSMSAASQIDESNLWHQRLGHTAYSTLRHLPPLSGHISSITQVCATCPLAKFTKLPYSLSDSHASHAFDLVHMDIWGPYKQPSRGKF